MKLEDVPKQYQDTLRKAQSGSRRAAIRCYCLMCVGWARSEVECCTAPLCPLFPFRNGKWNPADVYAALKHPPKVGVLGSRIDERHPDGLQGHTNDSGSRLQASERFFCARRHEASKSH